MTIFASTPDGVLRAFANESELAAFREAVRQSEPEWLKRLRKYRTRVSLLQQQAETALSMPRGRIDTLRNLESKLRGLNNEMVEDIEAAAADAFRSYERESI